MHEFMHDLYAEIYRLGAIYAGYSRPMGLSSLTIETAGSVTKRLRVRLTTGPLQATLSRLLTYYVLRPTQPPTLSGTGNE